MTDKTITVRLTPKASRNEIRGWAKDAGGNSVLKVSVTAVPEKGRANEALVALLAEKWDIPKRSIILLRGGTDRTKLLLIKDFPG